MKQRRNIVLITDRYPQATATEGSFVGPELDFLKDAFERVVIIPTTARDAGAPEVIEGVETDMTWAVSADWCNRWRRLRFLISCPLWLDARGDLSRKGLAFGLAARAFAAYLPGMMERNRLKWDDTLFYTFWFDFPAAALSILRRRNREVRYISRAHGHDLYTHLGGRLREHMLRHADHLYTASEAGAEFIRSGYPEAACGRVTTSVLGCRKPVVMAVSGRHTRSDRQWTFLSVSRVDGNKRVWLNARLLKALAVARPDTKIRWIHVGDGPSMSEVRSEAMSGPENFYPEFRGELSNDDVHGIYRDEIIDWTMLLSRHEGGRPVAVCESLAYGVPVVATDVAGLNETIDDSCGLMVSTDVTDEEFVRGIAPYLDSDLRAAGLRTAAFDRWLADYDASKLRAGFVDRLDLSI